MEQKTVEVLGESAEPRDLKSDFHRRVWERFRHRCSNCGFEERLRIRLVVPESAGGQEVESNAVLLCRACEMALDSTSKRKDSDARVVCFMLSRVLHQGIVEALGTRNGYNSFTALARGLVEHFVQDPERYDDLGNYQDDRSSDDRVKVNVWIGRSTYSRFKSEAALQNRTVTDLIVSLLMLYQAEALPRLREK